MMQKTSLDFKEMSGGSFQEVVNQEIQKVLDNIYDPNFKPESARTVTAKLTFKPSKNGEVASVECTVSSVFGKREINDAVIYIGKDSTGQIIATEHHLPNQQPLDFNKKQTALAGV